MIITVPITMLNFIAQYCSDVEIMEQELSDKYVMIHFDPKPDLVEKMIEAANRHGYAQACKQTLNK